jgi:hypothetical protein
MNLARSLGACLVAGAIAGQMFLPHATSAAGVRSMSVVDNNFAGVPAALTAGPVQLSVTTHHINSGSEIDIARLRTAGARAKVAAGMSKGMNAVFPNVILVGGVGEMSMQPSTATFVLTAGTYVVFNLDALTANKNPHSPYRFITVTGTPTGPKPSASTTVRLVDFKFQLSNGLPRGMSSVRMVNAGHEPHEMDVIRLAPGKTMADVKKAMMGNSQPKWITNIGGWGALSPGQTEWAHLNLTPGNYVLMCWVPDQMGYPGHKATNKPHVMLGMIRMVTVK